MEWKHRPVELVVEDSVSAIGVVSNDARRQPVYVGLRTPSTLQSSHIHNARDQSYIIDDPPSIELALVGPHRGRPVYSEPPRARGTGAGRGLRLGEIIVSLSIRSLLARGCSQQPTCDSRLASSWAARGLTRRQPPLHACTHHRSKRMRLTVLSSRRNWGVSSNPLT